MTDSIAQLLREAAEKVEESGWSILASDLVQAAASLEAQEPVATVSEESFSNDGTSDIITRNLPIGTTLYRHPPTSAVPELVAIAERLPERGEYVLIVAADRFWNVPDGFPDMNVAAVAYLDDYGAGPFWYTWGRGGATTDSYTHWMLIPAAPQQGGE